MKDKLFSYKRDTVTDNKSQLNSAFCSNKKCNIPIIEHFLEKTNLIWEFQTRIINIFMVGALNLTDQYK